MSDQYLPWNQNVLLNSSLFILLNSKAITWVCETYPNAFWVFSKIVEHQDGDHVKFPHRGDIKIPSLGRSHDQNPYQGERPQNQNPALDHLLFVSKPFFNFFFDKFMNHVTSSFSCFFTRVALVTCHANLYPLMTLIWAKAPVFQTSWQFLFQLDIAKCIYAPRTRDDKGYITVKRRGTTDRFDIN